MSTHCLIERAGSYPMLSSRLDCFGASGNLNTANCITTAPQRAIRPPRPRVGTPELTAFEPRPIVPEAAMVGLLAVQIQSNDSIPMFPPSALAARAFETDASRRLRVEKEPSTSHEQP